MIGRIGTSLAGQGKTGEAEKVWAHSVEPPNGSRLSCGRNRRWRKEVEAQRKRLAGDATQLFPTCERPTASSAC